MNVASSLSQLLSDAKDRSGVWRQTYDGFVDELRALGIASSAPRVGETFPAFTLPNAIGQYRSLDSLTAERPLVLSFNRGGWCPYCVHELRAWSDTLPALRQAGGEFAAITPEVGGRAALLGQLLGRDAELLCDVDHGLALAAGLAFFVRAPLLKLYEDHGLDLAELYGNSSGLLPVPATYVIDREGIVRFAFADPDFRIRAEPERVIAAVAALS